jgi:predicted metal-dependent peptidase
MYTPQQRIERAKVSMIRDPRFAYLAGIFMLGDTEVSDKVPTAQTNGRDVIFNPEFVDKLSDAELRALIYHEYGGHIMMRHLSVYRNLHDQDPKRANMACDYVVNQAIKDYNDPKFLMLPTGGLQDDRYRGMDSKQVFDLLASQDNNGGGGDGSGGSDADGELMDSHDWDGAGELSEQDVRALDKDIEQAVRQSVMASKLMGHPVDRRIEDWLSPQVDWREALQDFVVTACSGSDYTTYRKPRRRMMTHDIYMASPMSDTVHEVVLAIDTSLSIGHDEVTRFLSEAVGVCEAVRPDRVHVMYWGTQVAQHETYTQDTLTLLKDVTSPKSGGGTDVNCVVQYMQEMGIDPTCAVVLTDGYLAGDWGQWSCPVLWAITSNRIADVGTTLRITF